MTTGAGESPGGIRPVVWPPPFFLTTGTQRLHRLLLDVLRHHASTGQACRVTYLPPRIRRPQVMDCVVDAIAADGRVRFRPLSGRASLTIPIARVRRVGLPRAA